MTSVTFQPISDSDIGASEKARITARTLSRDGLILDFVSPQVWDELSAQFSDIIPEQTGSFNAGHWGYDNIECVVFRSNGVPVGGAVLVTRKIPLTGSGIAFLKWGPVLCPRGGRFSARTYAAAIAALTDEFCKKRNLHLTITPPAMPEDNEAVRGVLAGAGFRQGTELAAPERYLVNTDQSPDELLKSFEQKWRYNLKKAAKNDFEIAFANDNAALETFFGLYDQMTARKQFLDASAIKSLESFFHDSHPEIKPSIVLVSHAGSVTAGGVFFTAGETASYMFGATDSRALSLKAGYAMHWWIAEHFCNRPDIRWYDLGGNDLNAGLHQFKKGMVGKTGLILRAPPRFHFASGLSAKLVGESIYTMRDRMASAKRLIHSLKTLQSPKRTSEPKKA